MEEKNPLESLDGQLVAAMLCVGDLDAILKIYVSNPVADSCPRLQRAMLKMVAAERGRRDEDGTESVELPDLTTWPSADLLTAGMVLIAGAESAACSGDPHLINFAFRLLQFWFVAEGRRYTEEPTNA